jgi:hypothetical protein
MSHLHTLIMVSYQEVPGPGLREPSSVHYTRAAEATPPAPGAHSTGGALGAKIQGLP